MEHFFTPLFQGAVAGLMITVPVGPICLLCIQRSLAQGRTTGLATGFGSAVALAIYGTLGFASVSLLTHGSPTVQFWSLFIGAIVLCGLGIMILQSDPRDIHARDRRMTIAGSAASTFVLELMNPAGIMLFAGIAATMTRFPASVSGYGAIGIGIFSASMVWWLFLVSIVASLRRFFTPTLLIWLNRAAGIFIIFLGLRPLALLW